MFAISGALIGVLVIAVLTSMPDFIVGIRSVRRHKGGVALGDIFGAATINATLTVGLVALIAPFSITDKTIVWLGILFTALTLFLLFYFLKSKHSISRREGSVLMVVYVLFVITQILFYFGYV
jgi:cation:H+ antiporter